MNILRIPLCFADKKRIIWKGEREKKKVKLFLAISFVYKELSGSYKLPSYSCVSSCY